MRTVGSQQRPLQQPAGPPGYHPEAENFQRDREIEKTFRHHEHLPTHGWAPAAAEAIGNNLFRETGSSGDPQEGTPGLDGLGTLEQGMVESSNVEVVEELVNMITTQRAYEMNSKVVSTADQMLQYISQNI